MIPYDLLGMMTLFNTIDEIARNVEAITVLNNRPNTEPGFVS